MDEIDYKALLQKYMDHVCEIEGVTFVGHIREAFTGSDVQFTPAEVAELERMAGTAR